MNKSIYKLKKYSKRIIFKGNFIELAKLFCLATPEYCTLYKSLKGNIIKFIKSIANRSGTELENFITLEEKKNIIGLCTVYFSSEIKKRQLKTNLIMRNCINKKKRSCFIKKIKNNINSLPLIKKKTLYLSRYSILGKYQGKGFGNFFLNKVLNNLGQSRFISLHINSKNKKAIKFYTRSNFKKINKKNNYILYEKNLVL